MTRIDKLLSISSAPLAGPPGEFPKVLEPYVLGREVYTLLEQKNGFYAFESALHVFPLSNKGEGLERWNAEDLWRYEYKDLVNGLLFFAEDVLQDQFCLSTKEQGIYRFLAETGQTEFMAESFEQWADILLADFRGQTGWPLLEAWQTQHGKLSEGKRLMPKTPFFLGGSYSIDNLWAGDAVDGMKLKGDLATQTRSLPDQSRVRINVGPKPKESQDHL